MKIAIVGTGIAGLSAAWMLHKAHDITIFEKNNYAGGHSNTVSGVSHADVDTGFIVYNTATYPNLIALFEHLNVKTEPTDMSFSVSVNNGAYEYSGEALFAQTANYFRLEHYRMIMDIIRFYKTAPRVLNKPESTLSLGEYLSLRKYSKSFINKHILPMAAAIWSTSASDVRHYPLASFVRFFQNHGLFLFKDRPGWRTVSGGSRQYVEKLTEGFKDKIKLGTPVNSILRKEGKVQVNDMDFDHVILSCHSDQSLAVLKDPSDEEKKALSAFPYSSNIAFLHKDERFMPLRKSCWASWNYLAADNNGNDEKNAVCVTYWMNRLQPFLPEEENLFVTLNPMNKPENILREIKYEHPMFTQSALDGWNSINSIQGKNRTWFCGAWCGYGFHEDGLTSGLAVAEKLGGFKRPWNVRDISPAGRHIDPDTDPHKIMNCDA